MASIINASSTGSGGLISTGDASGVLQLQNNGTVAVTVTGGQVGIGTSSPNQTLEVSGSSQAGIIYERISNTYGSTGSTNSGTALQFYGWDAGVTANIKSIRTGSAYSPSALTFETFGGNSTTNNNTLAERLRISDWGSVQSTNGLGASSAKSQNSAYPTVMIGGSSGTTSCTNTVAYYQAGGAWEPMVYFVTVSACKGDLSATANANYVIRMTHYNGGTANTISTSGGDTGQFTLSYSNTGTTNNAINTSAITATVSASYDHIVMSIQAASWCGISSIT